MGLRIVFFGTPAPAARCLEAILRSAHTVLAVVTAPDRPQGRGLTVRPSEVKRVAVEEGLEVIQPPSLKDAAVQHELAMRNPDLFVVTAYGMILPRSILETPRLGCLNTHFSLLPKLRGAAPIQWALLERHTITGVTIMRMDEGLDTGAILAQVEEPIRAEDTAATLGDRLSTKAAQLLVEVIDRIEDGPLEGQQQEESEATWAPKISPMNARLEWTQDAELIEAKVRAMDPAPGAWTTFRDKRLKVWKAGVSPEMSRTTPGRIEVADGDQISVATRNHRVRLEEVQPEGRSRMSSADFIRGYRPKTGEVLS